MERDVLVQREGLEKAPPMEVFDATEPLTPVTPARALEGITPEQVRAGVHVARSSSLDAQRSFHQQKS